MAWPQSERTRMPLCQRVLTCSVAKQKALGWKMEAWCCKWPSPRFHSVLIAFLLLRNRETVLVVNNVSARTAAIFNCCQCKTRRGRSLLGWSLTWLGSARRGRLESVQFLTSLRLQKECNLGKKIARFSIGVNVWQLNKYMINNKTALWWRHCHPLYISVPTFLCNRYWTKLRLTAPLGQSNSTTKLQHWKTHKCSSLWQLVYYQSSQPS